MTSLHFAADRYILLHKFILLQDLNLKYFYIAPLSTVISEGSKIFGLTEVICCRLISNIMKTT